MRWRLFFCVDQAPSSIPWQTYNAQKYSCALLKDHPAIVCYPGTHSAHSQPKVSDLPEPTNFDSPMHTINIDEARPGCRHGRKLFAAFDFLKSFLCFSFIATPSTRQPRSTIACRSSGPCRAIRQTLSSGACSPPDALKNAYR